MPKVTTLEFFLRAIPEGFLFVFATYTFSKVIIDKNRYVLSSILLAIIGYAARQLPISYGVHTILALIGLIILNVSINKFEIIKAVRAVIITFVLEFICEGINFIILQYVFKMNLDLVFDNVKYRIIYATPSLFIFTGFVTIYYYILLKTKKLHVI